jgi:hypothetical protein
MPSANPVHTAVFALGTAIGTDPGAGANFSWPCPGNSRVQILYCSYICATDANAANRYHTLLVDTGALTPIQAGCTVAQVASKTYGIAFIAGLAATVDLSAQNQIYIPMAPDTFLSPGEALESFLINKQATDTISSIIIRYKQWIIA